MRTESSSIAEVSHLAYIYRSAKYDTSNKNDTIFQLCRRTINISQRKMEQRSTLGYAVLRCISIPVICSKQSPLKVISLDLYKVIIPSFYLPCGTKFLLVVIFAIFAGICTIRKK